MGPIGDAAKEVVNHRRSNNLARATVPEAMADIEDATCARLGNDPSWCQSQKKTTQDNSPSSPIDPAQPAGALSSLVASLKSIPFGAKTLLDWVGDGGRPVDQFLANARAKTCVECPENKNAGFFQRILASVANAIKEQTEIKTALDLKVDNEDKLQTCAVCQCHLRLKVWVPMKHILKSTDERMLSQFPKNCWVLTENRRVNTALSTVNAKPIEEE